MTKHLLGKCPKCNAKAKMKLKRFPDGYKSKAFCPWCGYESDWCVNYGDAVIDFYHLKWEEEDE